MKFLKGKRITAFLLALVLTFTSLGSDVMTISAYASSNSINATLEIGATKNVTASGNEAGGYDWSWSSSNSSVATFNVKAGGRNKNITITAVSAGTATITGTRNNGKTGAQRKTDTYTVNVTVNAAAKFPHTVSGSGYQNQVISWTRSNNDITNSGYKQGTQSWKWSDFSSLNTAITDYEQVWDGKYEKKGTYAASDTDHNFASWKIPTGASSIVTRFQGTFTIPEGFDATDSIKLASGKNYGAGLDSVFPINDDVFVFVYKQGTTVTDDNFMNYYVFWSGTSNQSGTVTFNGEPGTKASHQGPISMTHTDKWYCEAEMDNIGEKIYKNWPDATAGDTFIIDVFAADYNTGGAMDELLVSYTKNNYATLSVQYYKDSVSDANLLGTISNKKQDPGTYNFAENIDDYLSQAGEGYNSGVVVSATPISGSIAAGENKIIQIVYTSKSGLSVSSASQTGTYPETLTASGNATYTGNVSGYAASTATVEYRYKDASGNWTAWSSEAPTLSEVGELEYQVRAVSNNASVNNATNETVYKLTINKKTINYAIDDKTQVYGDKEKELTGHYTTENAIVAGDKVNVELSREAGENVGTYNITATLTGEDANKYNFVSNTGKYKITNASFIVEGEDIQDGKYNGEAYGSEPTVSGIKNNQAVTLTYEVKNEAGNYVAWTGVGYPTQTVPGVLNVKVTATAANHEVATDEYTIKVVTGDKLRLGVPGNYEGTYDGKAHGGEGAAVSNEGATITYTLPDGTKTTTAPTFTNVGTYVVKVQATKEYYTPSEEMSYTVTINPFELVVTADDKEMTYGDAAYPELTYKIAPKTEGTTKPDDATIAVAINLAGSYVNAGTYENAIVVSGNEKQGNYKVSYVAGKLTIDSKVIDVTITNQSETYNGTKQGAAVFTEAGYEVKYAPVDENGNAGEYTTEVPTRTNAGTDNYLVKITDTTGNTVTKEETYNYSLTIKKLPVTVKVEGEKKSFEYDGNSHLASAKAATVTTEGLSSTLKDEVLAAVKVNDGAKTSVTATNVGKYPIGLTKNTYKNESNNFDVTFDVTDGELEITLNKVGLTLSVKDIDKNYDGTALTTAGALSTSTPVNAKIAFNYYADAQGTKKLDKAPTVTNVSEGTVTVYVQAIDTAGNYKGTEIKSFTMKINPATVDVTVTGKEASVDYDGAEHNLKDVNPREDLITYDIPESSLLKESDIEVTLTDVKGTNAGTYNMGLTEGSFTNNNANFSVTFKVSDAVLTINKKAIAISVTGNTDTVDYNGTEQSVEGYVATAENRLFDDTKVSYSGTAKAAGTNASETPYMMNLNKDLFSYSDANFTATFTVAKDGSLTINKAKTNVLNVTGYEGTYDSASHSGTVTGYAAGTTLTYSTDGGKTFTSVAPERTNVGTTNVIVKGENPNYETVSERYAIVISKKEVTYTVEEGQEKTYGEDDPKSFDGSFGTGDIYSNDTVTATITREAGENAGTYDFVVTFGGEDKDNYEITLVNSVFTINKGDDNEVTVTGFNGKYDGKSHEGEVTVTKGGSTVYYSVNGGEYTEKVPSVKDVADGKLEVNVKVTNPNYEDVTDSFVLQVNPKDVTVTANTFANLTYGDATPTLTAKVDGLVEGESESLITYTLTTDEVLSAGEHTITVTADENQGNYKVATVNGKIVIAKKAVTITAKDAEMTYGDAEPEYEVEISGLVSDNDLALISYEVGTEGKLTAGDHDIKVTAAKDQGNYSVSTVDGTLSVSKKEITYTIDPDQKKTYGEEDPEFTGTFTEGSLETGDKVTATITRNEGEDAGEYTLTVEFAGDDADNYEITADEGTFVILKKDITITAEDKEMTYGGEVPEFTATVDGLVGTDTVRYSVAPVDALTAGTHTLYVTANREQGNYIVTTKTGTLTVNASDANVLTVEGYKSVYDGAAHKGSASATAAGTTITYSTDGVNYSEEEPTITNVGKITVYVKATNPNYTEKTGSFELEVTPKAATFTFNEGQGKTYGENDPELSGEFANIVPGDDVTAIVSRVAGENAGTYTLSVSYEGDDVDNYEITANEEVFTIARKTVTVTAANKSMTYGGDVPEFTATVTGLVTGESEELISYTLATDEVLSAGDHTITVTAAENQGNYKVETVDGTLTVNKADIEITPADENVFTYDGENHGNGPSVTPEDEVTVTYEYHKVGENEWTSTGTEVPTFKDAGTYEVKVTADDADSTKDNFNEATDYYTVVVNPLKVTVGVEGHNGTFGFDNEYHVVSGYDLSDKTETPISETLFNEVKESIAYRGTASIREKNANEYTKELIMANFSSSDNNFDVTFTKLSDVKLTITKAKLDLEIATKDLSKTYDRTPLNASYELTVRPAGANLKVLYSTDGREFTDKVPSVTYVTDGTKTVTVKVVDLNGNYEAVTSKPFTIKITKRPVTVTVTGNNNADGVTYDGTEKTVRGYKLSTEDKLFNLDKVYTRKNFSASLTDAGTKYMGIKATDFAVANGQNYDVTFKVTDGYVKVNPITAKLTVTANSKTKKYDGTFLTDNGYTYTQGVLAKGDRLEVKVEGAVKDVRDNKANNNVVKSVKVMRGNKDVTANYANIEKVAGTLTITKRTVKLTSASQEKTYDGMPLMNWYVSRDARGYDGFVWGEGVVTYVTGSITNVNDNKTNNNTFTYVPFFNTDLRNYDITTEFGTLKINKRNVTINVIGNNDTVTYNRESQEVTGYKVTTRDYVIKLKNNVEGPALADAKAEGVNAGTYYMGLTADQFEYVGKDASNYVIKFNVTDGYLTINPVTASIVVSIEGNNDTKTYAGEEYTVEGYEVSIPEQFADLYLVEDIAFEGNASVAGTYVDTYYMGLTDEDFANINENFTDVSFEVTDGYLTIEPKHITVKVNDATKTFGDADPEFSLVFEDGALVGEDELFYTFQREEGENVGKYAIYASFLMEEDDEVIEYPMQEEIRPLALLEEEVLEEVFDNGEAIIAKAYANRNYEVEVEAGELTITKRHIVIKANDAGKRVGEADPNFTTTITNAVDMDPVNAYAWRYDGEGVGKYGIAVTVTRLSDNYDAEIKNGTFTIYGEDEIIPIPPTPTVNPVPPTEVIIPEEEVPEVEEIPEAAEIAEVSEEASEIVIPDEEVALAAPANCYIHWIILAITLVYALYAVLRGLKNAEELREENKELEN